MADELRARVEELERERDENRRRWSLLERYYAPKTDYGTGDLYRDLTTPPPKERPKIEVVKTGSFYEIRCGTYAWDGTEWESDGGGGAYDTFDANAIAAALTAAGNYPAEYQETSR